MKKVSVIIPVYNTEKYLRRCADALVGQTLSDMELLFIDDGSTDSSLRILREYEAVYPQVKVIHKENGGQASARNLGIRMAEGAYIGFADSDDQVAPALFEQLYQAAVSAQSDLAECGFHFIRECDGKRQELTARGRIEPHPDNRDLFIDPQVSPWNKLYRREILQMPGVDFPEGLIYEDTAFYLKTIPYVHASVCVKEPLVYYFLHGDSTMNANQSRRVGDIFPVLQNAIDFYRTHEFYEAYQLELEYFCSKIILCSSFGRIGRVPDRLLRNELLDRSFVFLQQNFPLYRKNPYLKGKKGLYMKLVRRWNSPIFCSILGKVLKG